MNRFVRTIWEYYRTDKREMVWREDTRPYYVIVSEIMLQQTQVHRVVRKFDSFIKRFPDWQSLADAPTKDVLHEWSGLGYNRRALYLKKIAEIVATNSEYSFITGSKMDESSYEKLRKLPGIGPNTAGSILAFAFNIPHPFIETNIRSVFIHFFFPEIEKKEGRKACKNISDDQLVPYIEKALKHPEIKNNPREWYYALMDYGSHLKKTLPNPSRRSAHHIKQSSFKGSNRELRSRMLKLIMERPKTVQELEIYFKKERIPAEKISKNTIAMTREGFITEKNGVYQIA